jgi:hypothetical protein
MSCLEQVPNLKFPSCSLCHESVELTTAKVDENGKPVHDECYVQSIKPFLVEPSF